MVLLVSSRGPRQQSVLPDPSSAASSRPEGADRSRPFAWRVDHVLLFATSEEASLSEESRLLCDLRYSVDGDGL